MDVWPKGHALETRAVYHGVLSPRPGSKLSPQPCYKLTHLPIPTGLGDERAGLEPFWCKPRFTPKVWKSRSHLTTSYRLGDACSPEANKNNSIMMNQNTTQTSDDRGKVASLMRGQLLYRVGALEIRWMLTRIAPSSPFECH